MMRARNPKKPAGRNGCTARAKRTGLLCDGPAIIDTDLCRMHAGKAGKMAVAEARVRTEVLRWGLGDSTVDPGEVLLRLVTQAAARVEKYGLLLQEAYDAAERLKRAGGRGDLDAGGLDDTADVAREDLRRVFNEGGVAALVGNTYAATKDGDIYATGEAIRGLAQLEAAERDRCAGFATKAVAAGLAERQVRLAERQGAMIAQVIQAILDDLELTPDQERRAPEIAAHHLRLVS